MNEISSALRVANTAMKTVKAIDIAKKTVITASVVLCGALIIKFWRK